ncbi:low choriolytic enzyme-like [Astyanax mexicanus]|uniref:Metalloendopeptidase n=1 Tax=Astyanax mexicanus TaxID=7994 RepID=A0A8T2KQT8_ASTMX|nr:low choriolytic enzyme-like [Astyanax mexicanus]
MRLTLSLILLLLLAFSPAQSRSIKAGDIYGPEDTGFNSIGDANLTVSTIIEKANRNIGQTPEDPTIRFGDILVDDGLQNADRCTSRKPSCMWPRNSDGNTYIPYIISNQFRPKQKDLITSVLKTFEKSTCIRFKPRDREEDYIDVQSLEGLCYSFVGRTGGGQTLSLNSRGCLYKNTIQHEFLHALGFHHEQCRSDRDKHIRILYENIIPGEEHNFDKEDTNNLNTPYDYGSVMHYERDAFSRNGQPTMVPIPNSNVAVGRAEEMSANDILRIKRLYCD